MLLSSPELCWWQSTPSNACVAVTLAPLIVLPCATGDMKSHDMLREQQRQAWDQQEQDAYDAEIEQEAARDAKIEVRDLVASDLQRVLFASVWYKFTYQLKFD